MLLDANTHTVLTGGMLGMNIKFTTIVRMSEIYDTDYEGFLDILAANCGNELLMNISHRPLAVVHGDGTLFEVEGDDSARVTRDEQLERLCDTVTGDSELEERLRDLLHESVLKEVTDLFNEGNYAVLEQLRDKHGYTPEEIKAALVADEEQ